MEKRNIKRKAGAIILALAVAGGAGLAVHDATVDHSKELCPITKLLNIIPNNEKSEDGYTIPTGIYLHQIPKIKAEYEELGINDYEVTYGKLTDKITITDTIAPNISRDSEGNLIYTAPSGYVLINVNGTVLCKKESVAEYNIGTGIKANWRKIDTENGPEWVHEEKIVVTR